MIKWISSAVIFSILALFGLFVVFDVFNVVLRVAFGVRLVLIFNYDSEVTQSIYFLRPR